MGIFDFFKKKSLREHLKNEITQHIEGWDKNDIYAISLYVYDNDDNPCEPVVTLGYNTQTHLKSQIESASDEQEARWNYAFWLQNDEYTFGEDEATQKIVKRWIAEKGFRYYSSDEMFDGDNEPDPDTYEGITEAFTNELIAIVKQLHESGFIKAQFGKNIPVLIHGLEYYDETADQNMKANPAEAVADFVRFCTCE